jgi:biotin carboxylase
MVWVGPDPSTLDVFGNKLKSGELAMSLGVPTLSLGVVDSSKTLTAQQGKQFPVLFKALRGGGGLGHRIVRSPQEVSDAFNRCISESSKAFLSTQQQHSDPQGEGSVGSRNPVVLCETFLPRARHIEVQIAGDGRRVITLGTRECSAQRRFQKVFEVAPAPHIPAGVERDILASAVKLASAASYRGVGTMEFLLSLETNDFYFVECNPRLQVGAEHSQYLLLKCCTC